MRNLLITLALALGVASVSSAATVVIDGFEDAADPGGWQAVSPAGSQSLNSVNGVVPFYTSNHVTEGIRSGNFVTTWTLASPLTATNAYVSGGPTTYWSIRYNIASPGNLTGNSLSNTAHMQADVFNNNPYPVQIALVVDSSLLTTQLERGPLQTIPANSAATYDWDLATVPATGWVNGNGVITYPARVKCLLVYTDTAPTVETFSLDVDSLRNVNAPADVTPPAVPVVYSVGQGAAPGDLLIKWRANTEADLAGYKIYIAADTDFGGTFNRLTFPTTPAVTAPAGTTQITIPSTATGSNVYVKVSAVDNATPQANESASPAVLGASLRADGAQPADKVVLDLDRNQPGTGPYADEGYFHDIVYNGRALNGLGRSYDFATAAGVEAAAVTLTPNANGVLVWSNLLDGSGAASVALTTASATALTTFVNADGNLLISGAGLAEDLSSRGTSTQTFLADVLKAQLLNANSAQPEITASAPLASAGTLVTNQSVFTNVNAFASSSNEVLSPATGAAGAITYTGIATGYGAVLNQRKTVTLGFAFESAAVAGDANATWVARQSLMNDIITYLTSTGPATSADDWQLFN